MPKKIQNFAKSALVKPITINVGRAGAASLDVIQVCAFFFIYLFILISQKFVAFCSQRHCRRSCTVMIQVFVSPGSGICERGSEDGVLARVSPENISSCQCTPMF